MALARIISNSDLCSRELAVNLLERGYAVEIVSPDAIPDNIADLEVRVETGPADLLSASVEVRGGSHSSTLQFIHQLKSPSLDMKRPAPVVIPEETISDTFPALAIPANPPRISDLVATSDTTIAEIAIPALALQANPPRTTETLAVSDTTIADVATPALAIPANPPRMVDLCEPIRVSTTALATAIKPRIVEAPDVIVEPTIKTVVVEKPEIIVAPANPVGDAAYGDPPKKPVAFSEGASLIVMPSPSQEAAQKVAQSAKSDVGIHPAAVFKVIIPKPSIPSLTISKLRLATWRSRLNRSASWVRRAAVRPAGWFGWTALGFAGVVALGLSLELVSVRMSHHSPASLPALATAKSSSAADGFSLIPLDSDEKNNLGEMQLKPSPEVKPSSDKSAALRTVPSVPRKVTERSTSPSKPLSPPPARKTIKNARTAPRVHHSDDVIAPDTITYFNRPGAKPVPVNQLPRPRADSVKRADGVIAANSGPAKTTAKSGSNK